MAEKRSSRVSKRRGLLAYGSSITLAMASVGLVAPVASAQGNLTVTAGVGEGTVAGQAFMPGNVTLAVGDSLTVVIGSDDPHTITMGSGPADAPPFAWPVAEFDASALEGGPPPFDMGTAVTDGTAFINTSILPVPGSSATIEFTAAGTFPIFCVIHPGMAMEVTVVEDGPTTTQAEADAAAAETRQLLVDSVDPLREGQLAATSQVDNEDGSQTWNIFADASTPTGPLPGGGSGFMELLEFLPGEIEVNAGDTINWSASRIHTVTFLPEGMSPEEVFPSEAAAVAPLGGTTFDGTEPASSGFLNVPGPGGLATDYSLTFPEPGTYPYFCAIHASLGQLGVVTVS